MRQTIFQYIRRYLLPCVLFILSATVAHAHESSTAYLNLSPSAADDGTNYRAQYELSLRDLAVLVDIAHRQYLDSGIRVCLREYQTVVGINTSKHLII